MWSGSTYVNKAERNYEPYRKNTEWTRHSLCTVNNSYNILVTKSKGREPLGNLVVDWRMLLQYILNRL
jgi:hypothetical protein